MAKINSLRSVRDDSIKRTTTPLTHHSSSKAIKGTDVLTGKMRKVQAITATNYNRDDVEAVMMKRSENMAVKLAKAREQARKYNEKKGLPTTPIINDPAFASSILKENRHQGTEALTKNKPSSQGPMDIDAASNVKSSYHHQSDSTIMLESVDAAGNCLILDAD